MQEAYRDFGNWVSDDKLPIVYHESYNIKFFGVEKLHPFDSTKFQKVKHGLEREGLIRPDQFVVPTEATRDQLSDVHSSEYLDWLCKSSSAIAQVVLLPPLALLPNCLVQSRVHKPMRLHTAGTILAIGLAVERGWAINLGGGMHHASSNEGAGWCMYDDWYLGLRQVRRATAGRIQKALYVDLDVHQGNGVARDKLTFKDSDLFIFDMYNNRIWPQDTVAKRGIDHDGSFRSGCKDEEYLEKLQSGLAASLKQFSPDIILFNAGTDVLDGDPLGNCKISVEGVKQRDEIVWRAALNEKIPICMCLSGGYARNSAAVILDSISNLVRTFDLTSCSPQAPRFRQQNALIAKL